MKNAGLFRGRQGPVLTFFLLLAVVSYLFIIYNGCGSGNVATFLSDIVKFHTPGGC